ncbi:MAG: hypothetical protein E7448_03550, partial [Ruminococcaceae bacterium]|nr:hypothetical protein [Oscillospiraceae bacterium]
MKFSFKRILALVLTLALILPFVPALDLATSVSAATEKNMSSLSVPGLGVSTPTDATSSGEAAWNAMGANSFKVSLQGKYSTIIIYHTYDASDTSVNFTNNLGGAAKLIFDYSVSGSKQTVTLGSTTLSGEGRYEGDLAAGATVTLKVAVAKSQGMSNNPNGAEVVISNIQLFIDSVNPITFNPAEAGGSYTVDGEAVTAAITKDIAAATAVTLVATPASGYAFAGWYSEEKGYLSSNPTYTANFTEAQSVTAKFLSTSEAIFGVGDSRFSDLAAAAACAANSSDKTVWVLKDTTLTGEYTIPAGVTLLVPYLSRNFENNADVPQTAPLLDDPKSINDNGNVNKPLQGKATAYRTLTLAPGAKINVFGNVEVGAVHLTTHGGNMYGGSVYGKYGCINMSEGSEINLKNGANLYAWGYVIGEGTVNAANGATIYEKMQVLDYRGGTISLGITTGRNYDTFLFNQYYVQNVEAKTVLENGAALKVHAAVHLLGEDPVGDFVTFLGEDGMFETGGDTKLVKQYDPSEDRLILSAIGDGNGDTVKINGISLSLAGIMTVNSEKYVLPINSNFTINIEGCTATTTQKLLFQPGVRVHVAQNATLITEKEVYIFDVDQWGAYVFQGRREAVLQNIPGLGNKPSTRKIDSDCYIDMNGLLLAGAPIYTTAGGAKIVSTQKTGVMKYTVTGPTANGVVHQYTGERTQIDITAVPMLLTNADGSFTQTIGAAANEYYVYDSLRGKWLKPSASEITVNYNVNGGEGSFNGHSLTLAPTAGSNLLELIPNVPTKAGATFVGWALSPDGPVVAQPGDLVSVGETTTLYAKWSPVVITFLNADGSVFKVVQAEYGKTPDPEGIPTKANTAQYTYTFAGWDIDGDGVADQLPAATVDATYKAVFTATTNSYTVTWMGADGKVFATETVAYGQYVDGGVNPTKASTAQYDYTLIGWSSTEGGAVADIPAVTGNVTYWPVYQATVREYQITWVNGDGSQTTYTAEYGAALSAPFTPSKAADGSYTYEFIGWDANGDGKVDTLTTVSGNLTLTPVFTATPIHVCTPGEAVVENKIDATCTTPGSYESVVYCSGCGTELSRETVVISALPHTAGDAVTENYKDSTCTTPGSYESVVYCAGCGVEMSRDTVVIPVKEHTAGDAVTENYKDSTCTATGSYDTVVYCSVCGTELSRNTIVIPVKEHTAGDAVTENYKDSTCTATGSYDTVVYCSVCGTELSRDTVVIPVKEHTAGEAVKENEKAPTCDVAGSYDSVVKCSVCGHEMSRETIIVPALGHSYAYTNNGNNTHTYACAGCGDSVTEAHSYTNNACACGHTLIDLIKSSQATLEAMLRLDFTVDKSLLTGEDNYVVLTHTYADGSTDVVTIPQNEWHVSGMVSYS